jgi:molybdate transport system regulatory protein
MGKKEITVRSKIWVEISGLPILGPGRHNLLRVIDEQGSISQAARLLGITYRKAWGQLKLMEEQMGFPLVLKVTGGAGGGGARLTPEARELLEKYDRLIAGIQEQVNERFMGIFFGER